MSTAESRSEFAVEVDSSEFNAAIDKYLKTGLNFQQEFRGIGNTIVNRARALMKASLKDPVRHPGRKLYKAIQNKSTSKAVRVVTRGCPYAGVHHWGRDGESGPKYLPRAADSITGETLRKIERHLAAAAAAAKLQ